MFIDEVQINLVSGKGGDGAIHFRREKYVPRGGPDGGDGGYGASVILEAKSTLNTLSSFRNRKDFRAPDGSRGGGNNQTGRSAEDLIIYVPPGTLAYDADTNDLLGDLVADGEQLVVCKGGRGGRGTRASLHRATKPPELLKKVSRASSVTFAWS